MREDRRPWLSTRGLRRKLMSKRLVVYVVFIGFGLWRECTDCSSWVSAPGELHIDEAMSSVCCCLASECIFLDSFLYTPPDTFSTHRGSDVKRISPPRLMWTWIQEFQFVAVDLRAEVRRTGDTRVALSNFRGFSEEAVIDEFRRAADAYAEDLSKDGTVGSKALQVIMFCIDQLSCINVESSSSGAECVICSGEIEPRDLRNRETRKCVVIQGCLHRFHRDCIRSEKKLKAFAFYFLLSWGGGGGHSSTQHGLGFFGISM